MITNYFNKLFEVAKFKGKGITFPCGCYYDSNPTGQSIWEKCELHSKPFPPDHPYAYQSTSLEAVEKLAKGEIKN